MESSQNPLQSYSLALLTSMGNKSGAEKVPPFGSAMRQPEVTQRTIYHPSAHWHRLLQALIEHSPSPETVSGQFLDALAKCDNPVVKGLAEGIREGELRPSVSPNDWAAHVNNELNEDGGDISAVTELADFYLTHLIFAIRSPPGETSQDSRSSTPDPECTREISLSSLLQSATSGCNQEALEALVLHRDGYSCIVTGILFDGNNAVIPQCVHIIPFSSHDKAPVLTAIEMFTGKQVTAEVIQKFINGPSNAINLQYDARDAMCRQLAWGIEAKLVNNEWKYYFRAVKQALPHIIKHFIQDGDEIKFGNGVDGAAIKLPDPQLCNLHLAVAQVFTASGSDKILKDNDSDELALCSVEDLLRRLQW